VIEVELAQFRVADGTAIEQLQDGPIAHSQGRVDGGVSRSCKVSRSLRMVRGIVSGIRGISKPAEISTSR
jgi:hypothetical protein